MQDPLSAGGRKPRPQTARPRSAAGGRDSEEIDVPYLRYGIAGGCLGAFVVALFFLFVDFFAGRPFATPNTLGGALFLGEALGRSADLQAPLVIGYTVVHGVVFVAMGSIAANALLSARRLPASVWKLGLLVAGALFVGFELVFVAFTLLAAPSIWSEFSIARVAVANLLAAGVMALPLTLAARRARRNAEAEPAASHENEIRPRDEEAGRVD